jgi:uncharacterized RDD family membrane protein YckC
MKWCLAIVGCFASVVAQAQAPAVALPSAASAATAAAAPVQVDAKFSNERPVFGERVELVVTLRYPAGVRVFFPAKPDLRPLLFDSRAPTQGRASRVEQAGRVVETLRVPLLAVRTGTVRTKVIEIPWHEITAGGGAGNSGTVSVAPLKLTIKSQFAADTDAKPAPLPAARPLVEENFALEVALLVLGMMALAAGLTLAGVRYYRSRAARLQPKPAVPPQVLAWRRLEELERSGRIGSDPPRQVIGELSEILREYLSGRYRIHALDMTTTELLEALGQVDLRGVQLTEVRDFAESGDLVKFAGLTPDADELRQMAGFVRQVVDRTLQSDAELQRLRDRELARLARQKRLRIERMAPLPLRARAFAIDLLVGAVAAALLAAAGLRDGNTTLASAAYGLLFLWLVMRDVVGGNSPGKALVGLQIASFDVDAVSPQRWRPARLGEAVEEFEPESPIAMVANWSARLQRNLLMALPVAGLIAEACTALLLPEHRRLGDQWADTQVVDARQGRRAAPATWGAPIALGLVALVVLTLPPLMVRPAPKEAPAVAPATPAPAEAP